VVLEQDPETDPALDWDPAPSSDPESGPEADPDLEIDPDSTAGLKLDKQKGKGLAHLPAFSTPPPGTRAKKEKC